MQNTFNAHIDNIWKNGGLKLNVLPRIAPYLNFDKKKVSVNVFYYHSLVILRWFEYAITAQKIVRQIGYVKDIFGYYMTD